MKKQFGGKLTGSLKERYAQSPHWKEGQFENLATTTMNIALKNVPGLLYQQFIKTEGRQPKLPLPVVPFDRNAFLAPSEKPKFIWYGHSAVLMRWKNTTILIDPMLGPNAAPIAPFKAKRFSENTLDLIEQFPALDLVMMTHDHYDHLDLESIKRLKDRTKNWFVALGVGRHLKQWGVSAEKIKEFDWWDNSEFDGIDITFTPSRHFSGRGLRDRAKSLWGGWTFIDEHFRLYWSGDGGHGDHFKEIGNRLGPFDFAFIECGQYNPLWHQIHMYPEEAVQAAFDAQAKMAAPVHWGGFALAMHTWKDPIERFVAESQKQKLNIKTPPLGELFDTTSQTFDWWKQID